MNNKKILIFLSLIVLGFSCKKASESINEIKDKIIDAYWSDIDDLTIKIEGDEGYVVDFGTSPFGSNPVVFNPTTPYFKNIKRTGSDTWDAEIIKSTYDANGKLNEIKYEPTTISYLTLVNGIDSIILSNSDPKSKILKKLPNSYSPPIDPYHNQPIICDTISNLTTKGNIISVRNFWRGDLDYSDIMVRSNLYKPLNHNAKTKCHYKMSGRIIMNGNILDLNIYFSHKPTQNQTYKIDSYGMWGSIAPIEENQAIISFEYNYESIDNGSFVNVNVSGGKITATLSNVELEYSGTGTAPNCKISCVLND